MISHEGLWFFNLRRQKIMKKIFSLVLSVSIILNQPVFAQVAGLSPVPAYLDKYHSAENIRPVHLRSLSFDTSRRLFDLAVDKGGHISIPLDGLRETAVELLKYFMIGLSVPDDKFWVNLRPDDPDRIMDPLIEQTDIGKIMLEADLNLKKDLAMLTSPDTVLGREYWQRLYQRSSELFAGQDTQIPTVTRPWIVPGEIIVGLSGDFAYVYKATLKVMLEKDYLKHVDWQSSGDPKVEALNEYSASLVRQLILPALTGKVNSAPQYAALRQVYYSLILSQWFKAKYRGSSSMPIASKIDAQDLSGLTSRASWSKEAYYNAYRKSFLDGEYQREDRIQTKGGIEIRQYVSGGIFMPMNEAHVTVVNTRGLFDSTVSRIQLPLNGFDGSEAVFAAADGGMVGQFKETGSRDLKKNIDNLEKIYGDEQNVERELNISLGNNFSNPAVVKQVLTGMFARETGEPQIPVSLSADSAIEGLIFSGGAGSRFLIPIIKRVKQSRGQVLAGINSLLTNVDDGGATKTLIDMLEANGYGITPPVGDQVNALFNSFLTADKVFTVLDDSGRIKNGYLGLKVIGEQGSRVLHDPKTNRDLAKLEEVIVEALRLARSRDDMFETALEYLLSSQHDSAREAFDHILSQFKMIGIGDNLELRYKGGNHLHQIAKGEIDVPEEQLRVLVNAARHQNLRQSNDFLQYSVNLFNLARIIDSEITDISGKPLFTMDALIDRSHSIRNLLLIAAMYDEGLLVKIPARANQGENALTAGKMAEYQTAVNRLAQAVGISEGTVSLSSAEPTVLYAQYEDNVFAWKEQLRDKKIQRRIRFHRAGNTLELGLDLSTAEGLTFILNGEQSGPLQKAYDWRHFTLSAGDSLVIQGQDILQIMVDRDGAAQFDLNADTWTVNENISGDETFIVREGQPSLRVLSDSPGNWYDETGNNKKSQEKGLLFGGKPAEDVMFVPRFIAMQTYITETVNLSKIVDFGFSDQYIDPVSGRKMYKIAPDKIITRDRTNPEAMAMIRRTDKFLIAGPGSFFTSLIAHDMCEGIVEELERAKKRGAVTIFVFNANQDNETSQMTFMEMVEKIERAINKGRDQKLRFSDLFGVAILGNRIDYQVLLKEQGITDMRNSVRENISNALAEHAGIITRAGLEVFKRVLDAYIVDRNISVPEKVSDRYEWVLSHDPASIETVSAYAEKFARKLYEEVDVDKREASGAADMAKRSRGLIDDPGRTGVEYLRDQGVRVIESSLLGLVTSIDRGTGRSKDSLGFIDSLFQKELENVLADGGEAAEDAFARLPVEVSDFIYDTEAAQSIKDDVWQTEAGEFFDPQHIRQIAAALQPGEHPVKIEVKRRNHLAATAARSDLSVWVYLDNGAILPFEALVTNGAAYSIPLAGMTNIELVRFAQESRNQEKNMPGTDVKKYAGIDFRALAASAYPVTVASDAFCPPVAFLRMSPGRLSEQWNALLNEIQEGPFPYKKLKEFIAAVNARGDCYFQQCEIRDFVMNMLEMEENAAVLSSPDLKEIIAYLR